jgi:hypothetical protein
LPTNDVPHAGRVPGSGTNCCDGNGQHAEGWYRLRVHLPADYRPTPGSQNTLFEFHVDDKTAADAQTHGSNAYSTALVVASDPPAGYSISSACPGTPMFCTVSGVNARLMLQVPGGLTTDAQSTAVKYFSMPLNSLKVDHWYDVVLHVVWDSSATIGYVQWWVDGQKIVDTHTPTEYIRTDGTKSYSENVELCNYRLWANWSGIVDYDEFVAGPDSGSIGFAP